MPSRTPQERRENQAFQTSEEHIIDVDIYRSEDGLESQKRGDLEKHGLKPLYYGPFADSSHGQANAGLQVAVVRHETIL